MNEFFNMGGHGAYIWPSYAITTIVIVGILVHTLHTMRKRERQLKILREGRRGAEEVCEQ